MDIDNPLDQIVSTLLSRTGHDFTHYRHPVLLRRLEQRLQARRVNGLPDYLRLLREDDQEPQALLKDLLIGVTGFFRDRAAFEALRTRVLPALFAARQDEAPLRAWVGACSTGEEAYTLAMLMADHDGDGQRAVQLFASDIDQHAIGAARAGQYPASAADQVPPRQLARHFTRSADGYTARKSLRERIVFTRHDLLHDPAFSRLDLISCRNFLIYLQRDMHRHVLAQFHFALNPGGYLMLGASESVEAAPDLFTAVDAAQRIYQARPVRRLPAPRPGPLAGRAQQQRRQDSAAPPGERRERLYSYADIHRHKSVELAAPSILLDAGADIVHVADGAARFLRQAGGEPTRELAALVLPPLQPALRAALLQAREQGQPAATGPLRLAADAAATVDIQVLPFEDPHAEGRLMLVRFVELPDGPPAGAVAAALPEPALLRRLDAEVRQLRRQLHDVIEQADQAAGEMQVHGEEMQSTIEQLRAAVAELEANRDELRCEGQALQLDKLALQRRVEQADKAHDDLANLVASSGVATIFLDRAMRILRYTPRIADFFNVRPGDIGRPLLHITNRLDCPQLAEEAARVFDTLQAMEREVCATDGRDYIVRVHPYRTTQDRIEGAVMTFFDISNWRAAEQALRASEARLRLFVSAVSDTLYKMSPDWSIMHSLQGKTFLADTHNPNHNWHEAYIPPADQAGVRAVIAQAIANKTVFELEHRVIRSDGSIGWTFSRAIPLLDDDGNIVEWFGAATDITERKRGC